ncbi:MAG: isoprenylcysteine carboxylmethyltransferase family protein [Spirochaetaceae bacterium]|nr:isoprenylcysteine carboxylmethyltransferase family protein [Myxococcales bacterium]MCB9724760.1 isoprenylcysteine carboxylmethyltransferase family protein [Spirochaetaceae bacterium]HPG24767.1 isoprenylcysteine carboxylmethyltransferase family protein [Myxococcota bacterium]
MPKLALLLAIVWFLVLFVARSVIQRARTGSTGFKGFEGRPGSVSWWAGVTASAGLVLAPLAPVFVLRGWPGGRLWLEASGLHALGAGLATVGIAGALAAQLEMGPSWRIGVDAKEKTELVESGLFGLVRNPIFSFILASTFGLVLLVPCAVALAAMLLVWLGIELQVRAVEEPYLLRVHGPRYAGYASRIGRFVPGIGRLASRGGGGSGG